MSRSLSRSRSPSKSSSSSKHRRKRDRRDRSRSKERRSHKKSRKHSPIPKRRTEIPKAYDKDRRSRSKSRESSYHSEEDRKKTFRKEDTPEVQLGLFDLRRQQLVLVKETAAEVERRLAEELPRKLEEEIELRKEKMRMDLLLEIESSIRQENDKLKNANNQLTEELRTTQENYDKKIAGLQEELVKLRKQCEEQSNELAEERLKLLAEKSKLDQDRMAFEREKNNKKKAEQHLILNKSGKARSTIAFSLK